MSCLLSHLQESFESHPSQYRLLIEQIDREIDSMNMAKKFATSASHKVISHAYSQIGGYAKELLEYVSPQEAARLVNERLNSLVD